MKKKRIVKIGIWVTLFAAYVVFLFSSGLSNGIIKSVINEKVVIELITSPQRLFMGNNIAMVIIILISHREYFKSEVLTRLGNRVIVKAISDIAFVILIYILTVFISILCFANYNSLTLKCDFIDQFIRLFLFCLYVNLFWFLCYRLTTKKMVAGLATLVVNIISMGILQSSASTNAFAERLLIYFASNFNLLILSGLLMVINIYCLNYKDYLGETK